MRVRVRREGAGCGGRAARAGGRAAGGRAAVCRPAACRPAARRAATRRAATCRAATRRAFGRDALPEFAHDARSSQYVGGARRAGEREESESVRG